MNKEELLIELKKINIKLTMDQVQKIDEYCNLLIIENQKYNLTSITTLETIYLKHIFDSLTISKLVCLKEINSLIDIGTGAGLPGIILKIVFPYINVCLLEANQKKCYFLKLAISKLGLKNIEVIQRRAEEYANEKRESFDLVVSRAVADLGTLMELCAPFVKLNGSFLAMKANVDKELKMCLAIQDELGIKLENKNSFYLPYENSLRTLLLFRKTSGTKLIYPRKYEQIKKYPLKKKFF